ncbi:MAG: phosphoglycerate mutase [Pseudomonadota bacterium]|nr:phosphoglycerate mutase [Pseudomonadota bacterium]
MATATLLLPERGRFTGQPVPERLARALGRADAVAMGEAGERAQLLRHFELLPRGWPVAALTRSRDAGDAATAQWLRADPAWIRPDINGARMLACGEGMQLSPEDAGALLPALRPLFGDAGFPIDAPVPSRWYLRLPPGATLPSFPGPDETLGADLFEVLAEVGDTRDAGMRRWRSLLNEAQIVLHNHPWNARRAAAGKPPVNSLWFWGGGMLSDNVTTRQPRVASDDVLVQALAANAGLAPSMLPSRFEQDAGEGLHDLRDARDVGVLGSDWLQPLLAALDDGAIRELRLDFADGAGFLLSRGQRWRFWRKPMTRLA